MSERNITYIWESHNLNGRAGWDVGYESPIFDPTGRLLLLSGQANDNEFLVGTVHALRDGAGRIRAPIGVEYRFKTRRLGDTPAAYSYVVRLPLELVRDYGVREDEFLDVLFTGVERPDAMGGFIPIFPKLYRWGLQKVRPSELPADLPGQHPELLIEHEFAESYFAALASEVNGAFSFGFQRATLVLYRGLVENLVIELLRSAFSTDVALHFDTHRGRHHDLSRLIDSVRGKLQDLKPWAPFLDRQFLDALGRYRERCNAAAHCLELPTQNDFFAQNKQHMNEACKQLARAIRNVTGRPF